MALICCIQAAVAVAILWIAASKGIEGVLPFATFVCILLPQTCAVSLGAFELSVQRLVVILLGLLYLAGTPHAAVRNPLKWLIILHISWAVISTANSIVPIASLKKLTGVILEYYLLYAIFLGSIRSRRTIYRVLYATVAALTACCFLGLLEAYRGWSVLTLFPGGQSRIAEALNLAGGDEGRLAATFPHPILYGAALATAIPIALRLFADSTRKATKLALGVALLLMFHNLYKSFSRGPWLGAILALLLLLLIERRKMIKYVVTIACLAILVMIVRPGVYESISNLYAETTADTSWGNPKGLSAEYRFVLRRVAEAALARDTGRSLWGYGMESFFDLHLEGELAGHRFPFLSCDSAWIEIAVETGYVGLALVAALLLRPVWLAGRDFRTRRGPDRLLSSTLAIAIVSYCFMMLSVAMYSWGQEGYMLWIIIALAVSHAQMRPLDQRRRFRGFPSERIRQVSDASAMRHASPCAG